MLLDVMTRHLNVVYLTELVVRNVTKCNINGDKATRI